MNLPLAALSVGLLALGCTRESSSRASEAGVSAADGTNAQGSSSLDASQSMPGAGTAEDASVPASEQAMATDREGGAIGAAELDPTEVDRAAIEAGTGSTLTDGVTRIERDVTSSEPAETEGERSSDASIEAVVDASVAPSIDAGKRSGRDTTSETALGGLDGYLRHHLEVQRQNWIAPAIAAALVVDGEIVTSQVVGVRVWGEEDPAQLDDYFMLKSCTKPLTGYLAARIIDMKWLLPETEEPFRWSTTILDVFPQLEPLIDPAYKNTTVAALMAHVSGMPYQPLTEGLDEFSDVADNLMARRFEYVKAAVQDPPQDPSRYGGGSIIVAAMLERVLGQSWEELMQEYVYDELGMTNSGVGEDPYPPSDHATRSHRGASASEGPEPWTPWTPPEDFEAQVHAPAGRNPHASVLDFARFAASQLGAATTRPGSLPLAALIDSQQRVPTADTARNGFAIGSANDGVNETLWHNGTDGHDFSYIHVSPSENFAAVVMSNYPMEQPVIAIKDQLIAMAQHLEMVKAYDPTAPRPIFPIASDTFSPAAGYEADKAVDGSLTTRWATNYGIQEAGLQFSLGEGRQIRRVHIAEAYERVQSFSIYIDEGGDAGFYEAASGTTIGPSLSLEFEPVRASLVWLQIHEATDAPTIAEVWVD